LIFSLFLLFGLGYSLLVPMWEGPDEHAHFHLAWSLARRGRYPPPNMNYETNQPPLYYWLASQPLTLLDRIDPDLAAYYLPKNRFFQFIGQPVRIFDWKHSNYRFLWGAHILRWANLCFGGLALLLVYAGARRFAPDSAPVRLASVALIGLTPQYLHIVSTVSNDAFSILAGAALFWLIGRICVERLSPGLVLISIAALVLPVVTKLTVLPMGVTLLVALAWRGRSGLRTNWKRVLLGLGLSLFGLAFGLAWLAPDRIKILLAEFSWRGLSLHPEAFSPAYFTPVLVQMVWSFWGKAGWLAVGLPIEIVALLTGLAALGLIASLARGAKVTQPPWAFLWLAAALAFLMLAKNGLTTPRNQGRFLFPSLGAIGLLVANGWYLLPPAKLRPLILPGLVISLSALNLLLWFTGIIPVYFQPFLD
jgi:hypothetical protein